MGCVSSKSNNQNSDTARQSSRIMNPGTFVRSSNQSFATQYETLETIGSGAFGSVLLVRHRSSSQLRACKQIPLSSRINKENLDNEVRIMRELDHPNIVRVLEVIEEPQELSIVMEYCSGGDFFDKVSQKQQFSENFAAKYILELSSALNYMHGKGIVHRDVKPENLLFEHTEKEASLKLADFGTATFRAPNQMLTNRVGTCYYMAPEVLEGYYTEKCDVWSAGVILFLLLSGSPPFNAESETRIMKKIRSEALQFPQKTWANISKEARDLVSKMLDKNPAARPGFPDVLDHIWLRRASNKIPDRPIATQSLKKLNAFNVQSKLLRATLTFVTHLLKHEEISEIKALFEQMDVNRDGLLSRIEIENGLAKYGLNFDVDEIMQKCDLNGNGYVDYNEFLVLTVDWKHSLNKEKLKEAFQYYDLDGDGKISLQEIQRAIGEQGESEHFFMEIIKEADTNGDGEIDFDEFTVYLTNKLDSKSPTKKTKKSKKAKYNQI